MLLLLGFGLLLVFVIFLFTNVHITLHYTYEQSAHQIAIAIFVFHIKCYKKNIDLTRTKNEHTDTETVEFQSYPMELKKIYLKMKKEDDGSKILSKVKLRHFSWVTAGGTGDAITCGFVSGGLWAIKGMFIAFINEKIQLKCKPFIHVEPNFQQQFLKTDLDCMLSIRLGQAIFVLIKLMRHFKQASKAYV